MPNEKLHRARKLCAELQGLLLDIAVDYTMVVKNSSTNKRKPKSAVSTSGKRKQTSAMR